MPAGCGSSRGEAVPPRLSSLGSSTGVCAAPLPAAFAPLHVQPAPLLTALLAAGVGHGLGQSGGDVPVPP